MLQIHWCDRWSIPRGESNQLWSQIWSCLKLTDTLRIKKNMKPTGFFYLIFRPCETALFFPFISVEAKLWRRPGLNFSLASDYDFHRSIPEKNEGLLVDSLSLLQGSPHLRHNGFAYSCRLHCFSQKQGGKKLLRQIEPGIPEVTFMDIPGGGGMIVLDLKREAWCAWSSNKHALSP